jgi:hypothetical protein
VEVEVASAAAATGKGGGEGEGGKQSSIKFSSATSEAGISLQDAGMWLYFLCCCDTLTYVHVACVVWDVCRGTTGVRWNDVVRIVLVGDEG